MFAGVETELGELSLPAGGETNWHLGGSVARGGRGINQEGPVVLARLRAWADAGVVDVVFRSDPAAALHNPDIDQIMDVTLWFRDVPVTVVVPNQQARFPRPVHRAEGATPAEPTPPWPLPGSENPTGVTPGQSGAAGEEQTPSEEDD